MILLREIQEKDLDSLERLSQIPGFINLRGDRDELLQKIRRSMGSFRAETRNSLANCGANQAAHPGEIARGKYMFVAEDLERRVVVGTSMIASQHGTIESPHFFLEVGNEEKFSETINTGFIHGTLKLKYDTNGPSEIGGLVLDPEERNSKQRVGRQVSFARFLYLGMNRDRFKRKLLAELLPPLNRQGQSPLWEAIGRRFTNMDYWEADHLCQRNKEFIFSLFPTGKIYATFLPAEAKNAIGKVGRETEPVKHMLEKIGFRYKHQVDPFDGGPHLWADVEDLLSIKKLAQYTFTGAARSLAGARNAVPVSGLLTPAKQDENGFRAIAVEALAEDRDNAAVLAVIQPDQEKLKFVLGISPGDAVVFMPYY